MRPMIALLMMTTAVSAADECARGAGNVLALTEWSAEPWQSTGTTVRVSYENVSGKPVEMVDATVWFYDALDQSIGGIGLGKDPRLASGESATEEFNMVAMTRLFEADPAHIHGVLCTRAVLYGDGTKEAFD